MQSGANKDQGTTNDGATPLFIATQKGHLEVVRLLGESGASTLLHYTITIPLDIAGQSGDIDVVRFPVESAATDDEATASHAAGEFGANKRPRHHR